MGASKRNYNEKDNGEAIVLKFHCPCIQIGGFRRYQAFPNSSGKPLAREKQAARVDAFNRVASLGKIVVRGGLGAGAGA